MNNICVRFFVGCILAMVAGVSLAGGSNAEDRLVVTFIPVKEKIKELVTVELVSSDARHFTILEKLVLISGWRQERKGDFYEIPGKCTVTELVGERYTVDCWLLRAGGQDVLRQEVKTCEEVVETIKVFSRLRLFRPPSKKEKLIKITTA